MGTKVWFLALGKEWCFAPRKHPERLPLKGFLPLSLPLRGKVAFLALFLAACGGGTLPSSITLTVEDPMGNFRAAAYQVGTGSWQVLEMT
ncbi:MAG: hypothetical protein C4301_02740, partial [Thermus sp.]